MRMKSFTAPSYHEAMNLVRRELGPDAVILSTLEIEGEGVRVMAALESDPGDSLSAEVEAGAEAASALSQSLEYHRVPVALADRLMALASGHADQDGVMMLASALDATLHFEALPTGRHRSEARRRLMIVGPPGAGKTATAAKICARQRLAGGKATLITMDTVSAGAREQVVAFATALDVPLVAAGDGDELNEALRRCPADHLAVIDTVGINPFDDDERDQIGLALAAGQAHGLLALPAGGDALESGETAAAFAEIGARALIATRVDAARRLGGVLAAAQAADLTLMGVGIAPSIGRGLSPINPVALARLLLPQSADQLRPLATGTHP